MSRISRAPKGLAALLASLGGVSFALSTPPTDFLLGVPLGLAALFWALQIGRSRAPLEGKSPALILRKRDAFLYAWLWGLTTGLVGMRFIPAVVDRFTQLTVAGGVVAWLLLSAFQALGWGVGGLVSAVLVRRFRWDLRLAFPTGIFIGCVMPSVFSWTPASLISPWLPLVQGAEWIGERGLSWVLAFGVACLAWPLRPLLAHWRSPSADSSPNDNSDAESAFAVSAPRSRPWSSSMMSVALGASVFGGLIGVGFWRLGSLEQSAGSQVSIGLVQPNTDAQLRWEPAERQRILQRLQRLSALSEQRGAVLSVWPEAAYPYVLDHGVGPTPRDHRAIFNKEMKRPVLLGLLTRAKPGPGQYNSATLVGEDGEMQLPQAKMRLLWFGESVPLFHSLPWVRSTFYRAGGLIPGEQVVLLKHELPGQQSALRMGVLNCYEDILPAVGRRVAAAEPNLLVNVTNDAWFYGSHESEIHLRFSVLRAIEARRDLVRAVNQGVPAWIDRSGRIRARGEPDRASVLVVTPSLNEASPTLYVRAGDYPLAILLSFGLVFSWGRTRARIRADSTSQGATA